MDSCPCNQLGTFIRSFPFILIAHMNWIFACNHWLFYQKLVYEKCLIVDLFGFICLYQHLSAVFGCFLRTFFRSLGSIWVQNRAAMRLEIGLMPANQHLGNRYEHEMLISVKLAYARITFSNINLSCMLSAPPPLCSKTPFAKSYSNKHKLYGGASW